MWIVTDCGFFSIVQKPEDAAAGTLTVRARVCSHLDRLRELRLPELGPTQEHAGSDYPFRAKAPRAAVAKGLASVVEALDYGNVKDACKKRIGDEFASALGKVWSTFNALQPTAPMPPLAGGKPVPNAKAPAKQATPPAGLGAAPADGACGGVVFDDAGRVLMVKPTHAFGGYTWTFPKGRPDAGETERETALREVGEETGYDVELVARLPERFKGTTTHTTYFLMRAIGGQKRKPHAETETVDWFTPEEALARIALTTHEVGKARDRAVLAAACKLRNERA